MTVDDCICGASFGPEPVGMRVSKCLGYWLQSRKIEGLHGSIRAWSESKVACERHCSWGYTHALTVGGDTLVAVSRVWPVLSSPACPKGPYPRREFSFPGFLSLPQQHRLCRYTSGSRVFAKISLCSLSF